MIVKIYKYHVFFIFKHSHNQILMIQKVYFRGNTSHKYQKSSSGKRLNLYSIKTLNVVLAKNQKEEFPIKFQYFR